VVVWEAKMYLTQKKKGQVNKAIRASSHLGFEVAEMYLNQRKKKN
jgi:hypothetical protein